MSVLVLNCFLKGRGDVATRPLFVWPMPVCKHDCSDNGQQYLVKCLEHVRNLARTARPYGSRITKYALQQRIAGRENI